jgi:DMSO/TMAO reductase YedYZ molybdopterin-dependent catalytic subunit
VTFRCGDNYIASIDMTTALHPQTQLTLKFDDQILPRAAVGRQASAS